MAADLTPAETQIANRIAAYVMESKAPPEYDIQTLPRDQSLIELGILDSFGVVELVEFLEETWSLTILDEDLTKERMGSIIKMSRMVAQKLAGV